MSEIFVDTIRKTGGSLGSDIRVKNTSVYESDGGTSVTQNLVQGLAKQWIDFNGTSTVAIVDSFNSASISDEGTGDYRVNLTNAMRAQEGCINTGTGQNRDGGSPTDNNLYVNFSSTSQILIKCRDTDQGTDEDSDMVCTSVNGDLA